MVWAWLRRFCHFLTHMRVRGMFSGLSLFTTEVGMFLIKFMTTIVGNDDRWNIHTYIYVCICFFLGRKISNVCVCLFKWHKEMGRSIHQKLFGGINLFSLFHTFDFAFLALNFPCRHGLIWPWLFWYDNIHYLQQINVPDFFLFIFNFFLFLKINYTFPEKSLLLFFFFISRKYIYTTNRN